MSNYAISDIHGCHLSFKALLDKIGFSKSDKLYLLGDYIDRGPDSFKVVQLIIELQDSGHDIHCLKGNHEDMLLDVLNRRSDMVDVWLRNGGSETLNSYGLNNRSLVKMDKQHFKFYNSLEYFLEIKDKLLVHAGFNFAKRNIFKDKEAMIWIRDWHEYYDRHKAQDRQIIHGHTPTGKYFIEEMVDYDADCITIDNGCFYGPVNDMGHLCALEMNQMKLTFQKCLD